MSSATKNPDTEPASHEGSFPESREQWARFLSGFVHEIKTPLASLGMVTDLLARERLAGGSDKASRYTDNLRKLTQEMQSLVQDVGTLARVTGGLNLARSEPVSPVDVAQRATETARGGGWERGVSLSTVADPDLPAVIHTDPQLLEDALTGLLETAVVVADKEVGLRIGLSGADVVFIVEPDRGCGPGQDLEALFDPFEGGTSRLLKQRGARPLAPLLSREISRALGGDVEAVCREDRTACVLRIPREMPGEG
jgi:signal transduction histidine kinase